MPSVRSSPPRRGGWLPKVQDVPPARVALVHGCSRYFDDGTENPFFSARMRAARELYEAGTVEYLLVSGDNSRVDYDESSDMRAALMEQGVPEDRIVRDYAGFSTLDSVLRAREVFRAGALRRRLAVFSCASRPLYRPCQRLWTRPVMPPTPWAGPVGAWVRLRESLARVKVLLDVRVLGAPARSSWASRS